jgi:hypothetical protein
MATILMTDPHREARFSEATIMLVLVISTPRPERPSDLAALRQSFWPWIAKYEARGVCRHVYARVGRGAIAVFDVESNEAYFDTYPLVDLEATKRMLAAQVAAKN